MTLGASVVAKVDKEKWGANGQKIKQVIVEGLLGSREAGCNLQSVQCCPGTTAVAACKA